MTRQKDKMWLNRPGLQPSQRDRCACYFALVYSLCRLLQSEDLHKVSGQPGTASFPAVSPPDLSLIAQEKPWMNSLGMKFVPLEGTSILISVWETRVQDFDAFVRDMRRPACTNMFSLRKNGWERHGDTWEHPGFVQGPTHPVVGVSWEDAGEFCQWLTRKEQKEGRLTAGQHYRLPLDLEWSRAVGEDSEIGDPPAPRYSKRTVYPWGATWPPPKAVGNYAGTEARDANWPEHFQTIPDYDDGYARTAPVGSFKQNRLGLYDLGGNAWEWCADEYHPGAPWRILRGGAWNSDNAGDLRSLRRRRALAQDRDSACGFRCVLALKEPASMR